MDINSSDIRSKVRIWIIVSLLFLVIAAGLGVLLRLHYLHPVAGLNYKFFLHAHSHVMLLGWVFNALFAAVLWVLYADTCELPLKYSRLFWWLQVTVAAMLFTFPVMGYAVWSIIFSSLHILLSFYFSYEVVCRSKVLAESFPLTRKFVLAAVCFLLMSSLGPFALGVFNTQGLATSDWYDLSIYYYLHFQYNGWISFAILGLFIWQLESQNSSFNKRYGGNFYFYMVASCIPAYALSTLWTTPPAWVYALGAVASLLQIAALVWLCRLLISITPRFKEQMKPWVRLCWYTALIAFVLKILLQAVSAVPSMATLAYQMPAVIIAYLHLVFLGFVTLFLMGWFLQNEWLSLDRMMAKYGTGAFLTGLAGSEISMVIPPLFSSYWDDQPAVLLMFSIIMWLGLIMYVTSSGRKYRL